MKWGLVTLVSQKSYKLHLELVIMVALNEKELIAKERVCIEG